MTGFTRTLRGYRLVETRANGDTLQSIAARELGDASRWPELAAVNGLVPPYITTELGSAASNVLFAGQEIRIPTAATTPNGVSTAAGVLGTDILLANGAFTDDGHGGLATVSGADNLAQAIRNRLNTHPGDLVFYPAYGCEVYTLVGASSDSDTAQLAAAFVDRSVRGDTRVATTQNVKAAIVADQVTITGTAISVDGKRVPAGNQ